MSYRRIDDLIAEHERLSTIERGTSEDVVKMCIAALIEKLEMDREKFEIPPVRFDQLSREWKTTVSYHVELINLEFDIIVKFTPPDKKVCSFKHGTPGFEVTANTVSLPLAELNTLIALFEVQLRKAFPHT